jgi:hypothetical protein
MADGPLAVYAVRDFDLAKVPPEAEILILGDEEYVLRLNGTLIGANHFSPGAALDRYSVGSLLRRGLNRILVELRSGRGEGGLLCSLKMPGPTTESIGSDSSWRIVGRHQPRLVEGGELPALTFPAQVLGLPPAGRWGRLSVGSPQPPLQQRLSGEPELPARVTLGERVDAASARASIGKGALGARWITFDWGREVSGYLVVTFLQNRVPPALLFVGAEPPAPREQEPAAALIAVPGQDRWLDSRPRTFRYATVLATAPVRGAVLHPVDRGKVETGTEPGSANGVFGLHAPRSRTPIEHEVWREVERLSSLAVGEGL